MLIVLAPVAAMLLQVADHESRAPAPSGEMATNDKKHPDYVRCKSEPVLGSRAKRTKVCKTNKEWALLARQGNQLATEMIGQPRVGGN